tara:strand:- start:154 stop:423 length:270 start_codon:yes stop_codon:yes gene_type:complete
VFDFFKKKNSSPLEINHLSNLDPDKAEKAFARLFSSEDGKTVLAYLDNITFTRVLAAESSHELLRYQEGQRAIVATIHRLTSRGTKNTI